MTMKEHREQKARLEAFERHQHLVSFHGLSAEGVLAETPPADDGELWAYAQDLDQWNRDAALREEFKDDRERWTTFRRFERRGVIGRLR